MKIESFFKSFLSILSNKLDLQKSEIQQMKIGIFIIECIQISELKMEKT